MKRIVFFQTVFIYIVFSLLLTLGFGTAITSAGELTPESDIITLAVPSEGQTLYPPVIPPYDRYQARGIFHDVAVAKDGSFVVTWVFRSEDTIPADIHNRAYPFPVYARYFNPDGTPRTEIIEVCEGFSLEDHIWNKWPRVACDDDGNFVVCWVRYDPTQETLDMHGDIYARLFNSKGVPRGDSFLVNTGTFTFEPEKAAVAMNDNGDFVITWQMEIPDVYPESVYVKRFDSGGVVQDPEPIKVNPIVETYWPLSQLFFRPSVAIDTNGGFVVAWAKDYVTFMTSAINISYRTRQMVRRFDDNGSPVGSAIKVNAIQYNAALAQHLPLQGEAASSSPVVAMNDAGEFALSYSRYKFNTYSAMNAYYEDAGYCFFNHKGRVQGLRRKLDAYMVHDSLVNAMDNNGNLIMGWFGCGDKTNCLNNEAIYLMQTTKGVSASKSIVRVVENSAYDPLENTPHISLPRLDVSDDGRVVVVWHDNENLLARIYMIR